MREYETVPAPVKRICVLASFDPNSSVKNEDSAGITPAIISPPDNGTNPVLSWFISINEVAPVHVTSVYGFIFPETTPLIKVLSIGLIRDLIILETSSYFSFLSLSLVTTPSAAPPPK